MESGWRTPFRAPRKGEILDAGYGEFMVTEAFADELMDGGMTHVNGAPVKLEVVDSWPGCVLIRWRPTETLEDIAATAMPSVMTDRKEHQWLSEQQQH